MPAKTVRRLQSLQQRVMVDSTLSKAADKSKSDSDASLPESSSSKISDRKLRTPVYCGL